MLSGRAHKVIIRSQRTNYDLVNLRITIGAGFGEFGRAKLQGIKEHSAQQIGNTLISLEIAPNTEDAARLIMSWRNNPDTLANSFDSQPKQWPAFFTEYLEKYLTDPTLPCLFILQNGKRVGLIRFRRWSQLIDGKRACDISINVSPSDRGHGIAAPALVAATQLARAAGVEVVVADIKPHNKASARVFEQAGFSFVAEVNHRGHQVSRFCKSTIATAQLQSGRHIGPGYPCFIIAEAGSNWRMGTPARDMKMAKTLIDIAAESGADAVKFQTYKPQTTYVSNAGTSDYLSDNGIQESITDIFTDLAMPYEMLPELADYARRQNILFMSSPFSPADFAAIDPYTDIHKIASYEISHSRLIEAAARANKPAVLSTGASDLADIEWAVNHFQSMSKAVLCLMQCTARYPAPLSSLNLGTIPLMRAKFGLPVGLSDHTRDPITGPLAAVALGANLIEKHYTMHNGLPGPDHAFAIEPDELKSMVKAIRNAESVFGSGHKDVQPEEEELYWYARRGLQAIKPIAKGDLFEEGINLEILRPGKQKRGVHPRHLTDAQNRHSKRDIAIGDGIQLEDFS